MPKRIVGMELIFLAFNIIFPYYSPWAAVADPEQKFRQLQQFFLSKKSSVYGVTLGAIFISLLYFEKMLDIIC